MAEKFGFQSVEDLKKDGQKKFSLLDNNIVKGPSCRLLLLNVSVFWNLNTPFHDRLLTVFDRGLMMESSQSKILYYYSITEVPRKAGKSMCSYKFLFCLIFSYHFAY
jgi:hypothetical protein